MSYREPVAHELLKLEQNRLREELEVAGDMLASSQARVDDLSARLARVEGEIEPYNEVFLEYVQAEVESLNAAEVSEDAEGVPGPGISPQAADVAGHFSAMGGVV